MFTCYLYIYIYFGHGPVHATGNAYTSWKDTWYQFFNANGHSRSRTHGVTSTKDTLFNKWMGRK